jgi:hypothetical protein
VSRDRRFDVFVTALSIILLVLGLGELGGWWDDPPKPVFPPFPRVPADLQDDDDRPSAPVLEPEVAMVITGAGQ